MTKKLLTVTIFTAVSLAPQLLLAQAPAAAPQAGGRAGGAGGGRGAPPAPQTITIATAKKMIAAAEALATEQGAKVAIAVCDTNGDLVYFERMDGAIRQAVTTSEGKARGAIMFGMPTTEVQVAVREDKPVTAKIIPQGLGAWEITLTQGGLPLIVNGKVVGGIGVGGTQPPNEEKIAQAGIDAVSGK